MRDLTTSGRRFGRGQVTYCNAAIYALAFCFATSATAAVTESVTVRNQYGYAVSGSTVSTQLGGDKETFYVAGNLPAVQSEVGVNYIGTAAVGSFFFLHDNYCVGTCSTFSQTIITFTLTNNGEAPVDLRFDSQITPGHIARILGDSAQNGSFVFNVTQAGRGTEISTLYSATGGVNSDGIFLNTGNLQYNGLTRTADPDGRWEVVDWGTTNLSIPLARLGAGETTQVSYIATYQASSNAICADVTDCAGLQIVFGDPRNDGGVNNLADGAFGANAADSIYPVIGRNYDPASIFARFVPIEAPLPDNPAARPPTTYGPLFDPRAAVPEPGTWAMMIGGFGMIGGVARRRRKVDHAIA